MGAERREQMRMGTLDSMPTSSAKMPRPSMSQNKSMLQILKDKFSGTKSPQDALKDAQNFGKSTEI